MTNPAYSPSLRYRIRASDGAILERKGPCTDRQGFAVYMISVFGDSPRTDTALGRAALAYLDECEKSLADTRASQKCGRPCNCKGATDCEFDEDPSTC